MAEEPKAPPEPSPEEQRAIMLEKIREVLRYAVEETEDGPVLDLDLLCRLLNQRAVPYRLMNRELMAGELGIVRAEQDTQKVRADGGDEEAQRRLDALLAREKQILDLLWPI
ncbi:MAG TPA: hypothetical protein VF245_12650 [Solirubrobacterales bacterium]